MNSQQDEHRGDEPVNRPLPQREARDPPARPTPLDLDSTAQDREQDGRAQPDQHEDPAVPRYRPVADRPPFLALRLNQNAGARARIAEGERFALPHPAPEIGIALGAKRFAGDGFLGDRRGGGQRQQHAREQRANQNSGQQSDRADEAQVAYSME
jgi:hypothetical protein